MKTFNLVFQGWERKLPVSEMQKEFRPFTSKIDPEVYQDMRIYSIMHDQPVYEVLTKAVEEYLINHR